jgi:simple sugar transport system permease protein
MVIARRGDDMITIGIGLFLFSLGFFFYKPLVTKLGMPRLVILAFFVLLCVLSGLYGISVPTMIGNVLKRTGMFGVLALAMLPGIQCGITLNMGMTAGIIGGLLSTLIALEYSMTGWGAFFFSVIVGCLFAMPIGWLYSKLLNRLKGNEMTVSTYVGFSFVSLMSIAWMLLPFRNPKITWALGSGLRVMHNMGGSFGSILNNLWSFKLFGATIPTGLLLFFLLCCFIMWLFSRSKTGTAMIAAGSNPRFAEAAGINVNRMRTIGTTISTVIAAVGIIVYSQSFGFMQLYSGPRQMGFIAASAILIGGASVTRAKVSNVILGTFLFQGVLALGIQVANAAISESGLSEVMRILISNGIILYALTQSGGESRA